MKEIIKDFNIYLKTIPLFERDSENFATYFLEDKKIKYVYFCKGIKNFTYIPLYILLRIALITKAEEILMIHNHPFEQLKKINFSKFDYDFYYKAKEVFAFIDVELSHFIVLNDKNIKEINDDLKEEKLSFDIIDNKKINQLFNQIKNKILKKEKVELVKEAKLKEINNDELYFALYSCFNEKQYDFTININNVNYKELIEIILLLNIDYTEIYFKRKFDEKIKQIEKIIKSLSVEYQIYKINKDYTQMENVSDVNNIENFIENL